MRDQDETTISRLDVPVTGMHCDGCAHRLQIALEHLDGVRDVKADFASGRVHLRFDASRVDVTHVWAQIEDASCQPLTDAARLR